MAKNNSITCMSFLAFSILAAALVIVPSLVPKCLAEQTQFPSFPSSLSDIDSSPPKKLPYNSISENEEPSPPLRSYNRRFLPPFDRPRTPIPRHRKAPPAPLVPAPPASTPTPAPPAAPAPTLAPPAPSTPSPRFHPPPHCIGDPRHHHHRFDAPGRDMQRKT